MKQLLTTLLITLTVISLQAKKKVQVADLWPDGTPIPEWFKVTKPVDLQSLGKQYRLTDYRIFADGRIHTNEIQDLIDEAAKNGGGVIVVPEGTYMTGGLHFRQGTHL